MHLLLLLLLTSPAAAQSIVVDNSDGLPTFVTTGNDWTSWGMLGHGFDGGDSDYLYTSHTVGGSDRRGTATWSPNLPTAGTYRIGTWFRRTENRTPDADFIVVDGNGADSHYVLNQRGEGASGWVDLGTHFCQAGAGGCRVTLDANDDDHSDEANAVRFRLVSAGDPGPTPPPPPSEPEPVSPCSGFPGFGVHRMDGWATNVVGVDFSDRGRATGARDGRGAHSPNVDAGEHLTARGWTICDPLGEETITRVRIATRARTQYEAGRYELQVRLDAGGDAARTFTGTSYRWRGLDITGDRAAWTWEDVATVAARLSLGSHPGGRRDSDLWVDAFRIRVDYTTTGAPAMVREDADPATEPEPEECEGGCWLESDWWWNAPTDGTNADGLDDDPEEDFPAGDDHPADFPEGCGAGAAYAWLLLLLPLGLRRR